MILSISLFNYLLPLYLKVNLKWKALFSKQTIMYIYDIQEISCSLPNRALLFWIVSLASFAFEHFGKLFHIWRWSNYSIQFLIIYKELIKKMRWGEFISEPEFARRMKRGKYAGHQRLGSKFAAPDLAVVNEE